MHYAITFGSGNDARDTWGDWKLVPESPPVVPAPRPRTNYVDIPGRVNGPIDLSYAPFGHMTYERITGSWTFVMYEDYWVTPNAAETYESVRSWLHGRSTEMVLEEDPDHFFFGRFTDAPQRGQGPFAIRISYDLEPMRYNVADGEVDPDWVPDDTGGGGHEPYPEPEYATDEETRSIITNWGQ